MTISDPQPGAAAGPAAAPQETTPGAMLLALGIVFGDLGTSPLYTLAAVREAVDGAFIPSAALGILSLIFWSLIIIVSIKYCVFVLRADNNGEGGILALMSLVTPRHFTRLPALVAMGLFGAALIYGDGIITPAISVLSAIEGVDVASHALRPYVLPLSAAVLMGLFAVQSRGTARLGAVLGPVMLVWFVAIGALGLAGLWRYPEVLAAADPRYAIGFLALAGWKGYAALGGVFLAVTGAEALYADIGNVGRNPIRTSWYLIVLPALLLNYAGQVAVLASGQEPPKGSPFFLLCPSWAVYPMVVLATLATIIASQAIITGAFSLTRQAMQLGWLPGLNIRQTSDTEYGQIYVPFVNWTMMVLTLTLILGFGSSARLAGAYGTAVSTTMLLTTALLYNLMRYSWRWPAWGSALAIGAFVFFDLAFFGANLLKIADGGWVPLVVAAIIFIIMTTWHGGVAAIQRTQMATALTPPQFRRRLARKSIARVPGTAVFLTRMTERVPEQIVQHLEQFGALPETLIALTVSFAGRPRVAPDKRLEMTELFDGFWKMTVHYGFIEVPNLPAALRGAKARGCPVDFAKAVYIGAPDRVIRDRKGRHLWRWQLPIFAFLFRNSVHLVERFNLPPQNFVEIGRQIEI
ncbi:MAG TPA: KUP/HAK/KT family potassium transporter [Stellaceae bacterium]|nr:KUP/HAK/KT family potassium transporter [Stellaceae bacterium]